MKRALIVGIDDYDRASLSGCVNDAYRIFELMRLHEDGSPNFDCKIATSKDDRITRSLLKQNIEFLFKDEADAAFLYFSGHGTSNNLGGFLVTQDAEKYDEGVSMGDILKLANDSKVKECIIMLDCCYSGNFGNFPEINNNVHIREGVSILTACRENQLSFETNGSGLFTSLVCDALKGSASDLLGMITAASIYAHVEPIFGAWEQRPLFKTHISKSTVLRRSQPKIEPELLREITKIFQKADAKVQLDKSYEPTEKPRNAEKEKILGILQKFRAQSLVVPEGEDHLYYAAMNEKCCSLTPMGQFYWHLANAGKI